MSSNITLYRKYRPSTFSDVEGQEFVTKTLRNAIINNKITHAYIFSGSRGIGKTSIAKIFAKTVNCLENKNGDACNNCENCKLIIDNKTMDVVEMDAASNNGVSDIRAILENIVYVPSQLKYKVYIIDEAHMLTNAAWNALLKTIEEPPKHLIFIFATTESHKLPLTIISRCQKFSLSNLSIYELEKTIKKITEQENIKITQDSIRKLATISLGSARDCLTFLGQLDSYTNSNISINDINKVFGLVDVEQKLILIKNIVKCQFEKVINLIKEFEIQGVNFYQLSEDIIQILFDKLVYLKTNNDSLMVTLTQLNSGFIEINPKELINLIQVWENGLFKMKSSTNQKLFFELTCLSGIKIFNINSLHDSNLNKNNTQSNEIYKDIENSIIVKKEIGNFSLGNKLENNEKIEKKDSKIKSDTHFEKENKNDCNNKNTLNNTNLDKVKEDVIDIDNILKKSIKINEFKIIEDKKNTKQKEHDNNLVENEYNLFSISSNDDVIIEKNNDRNNKEKIVSEFKNKLKEIAINVDKSESVSTLTIDEKIITKDNSLHETIKKELGEMNEINQDEIYEHHEKSENLKSISLLTYSIEQKKDIFFKVANNLNNNEKVKISNELNKIKKRIPNTLEEGYLTSADKVLLASNNAAIILFKDEISCRNLNVNSNTQSFLKYLNSLFGKIYLLLAITNNEAMKFGNEYKEMISKNKSLKLIDVNIDDLLNKINKKESIKDLAEEMLGDLIEEGE